MPPLFAPTARDAELVAIEREIRTAVRRALTQPTRKPFRWGSVVGYEHLEAIASALNLLPATTQTAYLRTLAQRVQQALSRTRSLAEDLQAAYSWLREIAVTLHYPLRSDERPTLSRHGITDAIESLLRRMAQAAPAPTSAQARLLATFRRLWRESGPDWLWCYEIAALPPDNLALEACFGTLRRSQRRHSGRQATTELARFGQYQILVAAPSEADLLAQLREAALTDYHTHRQRLAQAEARFQTKHRFQRDPAAAITHLLARHLARCTTLAAAPAGRTI